MKIQYRATRISFHGQKESRLFRNRLLRLKFYSLSTMIKQLSHLVIWRSLVTFKKTILSGLGVRVNNGLKKNRKRIREVAITGDFLWENYR